MIDARDFILGDVPEEAPAQEAPPLVDDRPRAKGTDEVLPANIDAEKPSWARFFSIIRPSTKPPRIWIRMIFPSILISASTRECRS